MPDVISGKGTATWVDFPVTAKSPWPTTILFGMEGDYILSVEYSGLDWYVSPGTPETESDKLNTFFNESTLVPSSEIDDLILSLPNTS